MKKLLVSLRGKGDRGEKTKLKKPEPSVQPDPLARSSLFTKKNSVRRRPATASRIPVEYPTPPDAMKPVDDLPSLPGIDGLPSLMDSTSGLGTFDSHENVDAEHLGTLDFSSFELPKERALPSVKQSAVVSRAIGYAQVEENRRVNVTSEPYLRSSIDETNPMPQSQGLDLNAAVQLIENLRKTASPEELAALQNALNPNMPTSQSTSSRPKSLGARVASHVAHFEASGPTSQPTSPTWRSEMLVTSPLSKIEYLGDGPKPSRFQDGDLRSTTPVDLDHSHLGALNFGTLAITNGAPNSPAQHARKSSERQRPNPQVQSSDNDIRSEEYFTPDEYPKSWIEPEDEKLNRTTKAGFKLAGFMASQNRNESPLKQELRSTSESSDIQLEQISDPRTLNQPSKNIREPVVKLAELINADDESIDLETDDVSRNEGIYSHSRNGSTQSRVSLANQYIADIPASPFEVDSPKPDTGAFSGDLDNEVNSSIARNKIVEMSASGLVHTRTPSYGDNAPMVPHHTQTSHPIDIPEIPVRKQSVNSRPSQAHSDDSGYSSASASHHAHDAVYDIESGQMTTNSSFVAGNSSTPLDISLISTVDSEGLDQSFASYAKGGDSPVTRELQMEFDQFQSPTASTQPQSRPLSPVSPVSNDFSHRAPPVPQEKKSTGQMVRPKSHHGSYFAATTSGSALQRPTSSTFLQKPYEPDWKSMNNSKSQRGPAEAKDSNLSKSVTSLLLGSTKRVKSERRKSIKNGWGLFRSSEDGNAKDSLNKLAMSTNNQSKISVVSTKSVGDGKTTKKLQKKKSQRPVSSHAGSAPSKTDLVPAIPTDLKKRFGDREVYVDISSSPDLPATIGVPYESTVRSETPMMQLPKESDSPVRQLPMPPTREPPQAPVSNGSRSSDRRFSLGRLTGNSRSKSSANLVEENRDDPGSDDEFLNDEEFPKGYMTSIPIMSDPALGRSPYDLPTMPSPQNSMGHRDAPRVPPIPGRHLPQGYGRPPMQNQWNGPAPRSFRPPGPGGPMPQTAGRSRPMSYHGRAPPPRRRMEVVGEGDEDGHSHAEVTDDSSFLDAGEGLTMSRTPSGASMRISSNGTIVRPKSTILSGSPMGTPPLGPVNPYSAPNGYGYPPIRVSSSSSIKRMSLPAASVSMQHWKSQPDLRDEANRNSRYSQGPRSPRLDDSGAGYFDGPSKSPRLNNVTGFHGPPPVISQQGNGALSQGSFVSRSSRPGEGDFLQRPVSRSSSIMSGRSGFSTSTATGPRPYPGPKRNSMMVLDSLGNTVGAGPYPIHPRQGPPPNPYNYGSRNSPRMGDGPFPQLPPQSRGPRARPMSTMMMGMSIMETGGPYPYPQPQNPSQPPMMGGWGPRPMSGHSMRSTSGFSQRSVSGNQPRPGSRDGNIRPMSTIVGHGGFGVMGSETPETMVQ